MIQIEGYRLLRQIGAGGMGVIHEAEQIQLRRTVALKLLRSENLDIQFVKRLEFEAQVLGQLRHPGIAQIYEAGWFDAENGRQPFFAMELVHGEPLSTFAESHKLGIREKLELLAKICEAAGHAHEKEIIHRDLKPENILVEEGGQPKILDFGLARAMSSDVKAVTTCQELNEVLGTILYMSPEQTEGRSDKVDARSDVYALGVLGYELLTGHLPHSSQGRSLVEYVYALHQEEIKPISTHNRELRGDIETIIAKALMREKPMRYANGSDMANDIRRYLSDQPIHARPVSGVYRISRYARRNKAIVIGVCATLLAATIGLVATFTLSIIASGSARQADSSMTEAERQRSQADRERYLAALSLATLAGAQDRATDAKEVLLKTPPNLRGWEWSYLWRQCNPEITTIQAHTEGIRDVDFSPDGKTILSVSNDKTARLWDVFTGESLATMQGHTDHIIFGRFNADGTRVITASEDNTVRLWNTRGESEVVLEGHSAAVNKARFSPDGKRIVTAADDSTARLWDASTGAPISVLTGHTDWVWDVSFDPTGAFIATASDDHTARLWDGFTGAPLAVFEGHSTEVNAVRFHPSQQLLLTIAEDGEARTWDFRTLDATATNTPRVPATLVFEPHIPMSRWVEFLKGGSQFLTVSRMARLLVRDTATGLQVGGTPDLKTELEDVALSRDGSQLLMGSKDYEVLLFPIGQTLDASSVATYFRGHSHFVTAVAFRPDMSAMASGSGDGNLRVWPSPSSGKAQRMIGSSGPVFSTQFTRDGRLFMLDQVAGWSEIKPRTLDHETKPVWKSPGAAIGAIRPDGLGAASFNNDEILSIHCADKPDLRIATGGRGRSITDVEFSFDGRRILTAGPHEVVTLWNADDGSIERRLEGHTEQVSDVIFADNDRRVVSMSEDKSVKIWDSESGECLKSLPIEYDPSTLTASPDGKSFIVATSDKTMTVVSLEPLREVKIFPSGQRGGHLRCAFTPDRSRLATATDESIVKFWDGKTFEEITVLAKPPGIVRSMCFSPDGRYLVLGYESGSVALLDAGPDSKNAKSIGN